MVMPICQGGRGRVVRGGPMGCLGWVRQTQVEFPPLLAHSKVWLRLRKNCLHASRYSHAARGHGGGVVPLCLRRSCGPPLCWLLTHNVSRKTAERLRFLRSCRGFQPSFLMIPVSDGHPVCSRDNILPIPWKQPVSESFSGYLSVVLDGTSTPTPIWEGVCRLWHPYNTFTLTVPVQYIDLKVNQQTCKWYHHHY